MPATSDFVVLHGCSSSLLLHAPVGGWPSVLYFGERLGGGVSAAEVFRLRRRQGAKGGPSEEVVATLSCEPGTGYLGPSGLNVHREGRSWAPTLRVISVEQEEGCAEIRCRDDAHGVHAVYRFTLDARNDVLAIDTELGNDGDDRLAIDWAAVACIPLAPELDELMHFSGRWSGEFQTDRHRLRQGGFLVENRRGRTSHDRFPGLVLCTARTDERAGACLGVHLAWSGNSRLRVDTLADGRRILQCGELLLPGELRLAANERYRTPRLYLRHSASGLSEMSAGFHDYFHRKLKGARTGGRPRPVHYNTWEAVYFDHSLPVLTELVDAAADIGVERFVLDDGWFKGRRDERSGLGDWVVDRGVFPEGLHPLIERVHSRGMEFGLWVEPEMISEDSDLFRAHPDWVLAAPPAAQTPFRHQLVLDMARPEVADNVFGQIDALLDEYEIGYLKWDMNRDLNHPGARAGTASVHAQTHAVYSLIDRLREKHPQIEIESCASGGARTDLGILARTDRLWVSDNNDAIDRQRIQRGASFFFPLSVIGAHVGARRCHVTNRVLPMALRAPTAMFGHLGVEADLLGMDDADRAELGAAIALYKEHRELIHGGELVRLDGLAWQNAIGVVSRDRRSALFSYCQLESHDEVLPGVLRFAGLDATLRYRLRLIWPASDCTPTPQALENSGLTGDGYEVSGEALVKAGLQLPLLYPQTCLVFALDSV